VAETLITQGTLRISDQMLEMRSRAVHSFPHRFHRLVTFGATQPNESLGWLQAHFIDNFSERVG
jgi:hypothetical protein